MIRCCARMLILVLVGGLSSVTRAETPELKQALDRAGDNREEIEKALRDVPADQADGMRFLIENMPDRDLTSLSAEFLLENSDYAWKSLRERPWADQVPPEIVFDSLLPYASVTERRDRWRKDFYERLAPLVAGAKTPSQATAILNQSVFPTLKVKYSTGRKKADQSPYESMESGLASCTGLSVLLVDACRAAGVPARIVGTPLWSDKSGNHTWVEIWDDGWHFTGACEPTGGHLDQAWFTGRASQAQRNDRLHAIYAVTFRRNGQPLPMVWARDVHDVFAVNVTDRYATKQELIPDGHAVVRFRMLDQSSGTRLAAVVVVRNAQGATIFEGLTRDERFDLNDHLTAVLPTGIELKASTVVDNAEIEHSFRAAAGEQLITLQRHTAASP